MKKFLMAVAIAATASPALALNFGDTTNNHGGKGGDASAIAGAAAISGASASSDATAIQGQAQIQGQSLDNTTIVGVSNKASGGDADASAVNNGNNTNIAFAARKREAASAYAPALAAGVNPCVLSASVGAQNPVFGMSLGATFTDEECDARAWVATLIGMGEEKAARILICRTDGTGAAAMRIAGLCDDAYPGMDKEDAFELVEAPEAATFSAPVETAEEDSGESFWSFESDTGGGAALLARARNRHND